MISCGFPMAMVAIRHACHIMLISYGFLCSCDVLWNVDRLNFDGFLCSHDVGPGAGIVRVTLH